jgi:hypothetical protein
MSVSKRYKGYNIVTESELRDRPDALDFDVGGESGKIVDLDPSKHARPVRSPSGKYDSYSSDTAFHVLVNIPPIVKVVDGEERIIYMKVATRVRSRWVSTDGKNWNRLYFYR